MASKREIAQRIKDAGKRARAEAEARRSAEKRAEPEPTPEIGGRNGPDPTRFGDWEKNGLISDF
jgi:hypothetical protein